MLKKNHWMSAVVMAGGAAIAMGVATPARAAILADSVADFSTPVQGVNGWTYLQDRNDAAPQLMDVPSNGYGLPNPSWSHSFEDFQHYYTTLWATGAHPGGDGAGAPGSTAAIRRWTNASYTGL